MVDLDSIPTVSTRLRPTDILGRWRMRWTIGRMRYRVSPGLYRVGAPDGKSPVLVTANYKLTFDTLRSRLEGVDAWILVLDTKGVNVWCAAGKGTFGTVELVKRIEETRLSEIVTHRKLVIPQLGATGISAHMVKQVSDFRVVYGPVRARDVRTFLENGMSATNEMRRVTFTAGERFVLVGAEVVPSLKWMILLIFIAILFSNGTLLSERLIHAVRIIAPILAGFLAGTVLVPVLLPWIPGSAFSFKGAILGAATAGLAVMFLPGVHTVQGKIQVFLLGVIAASYFAMQFTGSTTFTSPSGVVWEMKRALPFQVGTVAFVGGISMLQWLIG